MLRVILNRLKPQAEEIIAEKQAGFRAGRRTTGLDGSQHPDEDLQPTLREEAEIAVSALNKGKSAGVENIPAELVQARGESIINVLTKLCNKIGRIVNPMDSVAVFYTPLKGQPTALLE